MIELVQIAVAGDAMLDLTFSDGTTARWIADALIARDTVLTRPLTDPAYFARAFIEAGALAWPNGLELSPMALHRRLEEAGVLMRKAAQAYFVLCPRNCRVSPELHAQAAIAAKLPGRSLNSWAQEALGKAAGAGA